MTELQYQPLVSIVIPCYNHAQFVQETIQSVIDQDYKNIELIIIDDGSKDLSADKIKEMIPACENRFKRFEFRCRPNKGLCATLNEAILIARGKYYSAIASDDILMPYKISQQIVFLETNVDIDAIFGAVDIIDKNSNYIKSINKGYNLYSFKDVLLHDSFLPAPTALLRRQRVIDVGLFNEDYLIEDWYLWLKLLEGGGSFVNTGNIVVKYRRHDTNTSKNIEVMWAGIVQILNDYKHNALYKKALSGSMLTHANDIQCISKVSSLPWFFKALKTDFELIFKAKTFKYILKLFMPKYFFSR